MSGWCFQRFASLRIHSSLRAAPLGVLVVAAMGNEGEGNNAINLITQVPGVLGIGAIDETGEPLKLTSHGHTTDLSAYGSKAPIRCKDNTAWCVSDGGTSYTSALASASAALVWSAHSDWTANQVTRVLIETAGGPEDGSKRNDWIGYGTARPSWVLLKKAGNPGPPNVDPLAPAPTNTPAPAPSQTAATPAEAAAAEAGLPWQWLTLGAVVAAGLGLVGTPIVKRRRS
ncbi:S8 family serine peptidase [Streptomyces sp. NPDC059447]|uniref:S8 family serine peptidase n=1 Tax=Streptomyces sp. NPDC059447 TaxID=3346834 RepID=UPI0036C5F38A